MEINQLLTVESHEAGAECNILSPVDRSETDVFIKIMGADSKAWRNAKKKQTAEIISKRASGDTNIDYDAMDIKAISSITIGWSGITKDGKEWPCNDKNKKELFTNSPFIVEQLLDFLSKGENFIKG